LRVLNFYRAETIEYLPCIIRFSMKPRVRCTQINNNATLFSSANRNLSSSRQTDRRSRFAPEKDARSSPGCNVKGVSEWRDRGATWSGGKTHLSRTGIDHDWSIPRSRRHHRRLAPDRDPGSENRRGRLNQHPLDEERQWQTGERETIISSCREVDERLGPPAETDAFLRWRHSRGRGTRGQHRTVRPSREHDRSWEDQAGGARRCWGWQERHYTTITRPGLQRTVPAHRGGSVLARMCPWYPDAQGRPLRYRGWEALACAMLFLCVLCHLSVPWLKNERKS